MQTWNVENKWQTCEKQLIKVKNNTSNIISLNFPFFSISSSAEPEELLPVFSSFFNPLTRTILYQPRWGVGYNAMVNCSKLFLQIFLFTKCFPAHAWQPVKSGVILHVKNIRRYCLLIINKSRTTLQSRSIDPASTYIFIYYVSRWYLSYFIAVFGIYIGNALMVLACVSS